jgi:hypothetical protein
LPEGNALSLTDFLSLKSMQKDNIILDRSTADIDGNTRKSDKGRILTGQQNGGQRKDGRMGTIGRAEHGTKGSMI